MKDLTYEETVELEKNVIIKKQADQLYQDFLNNMKLKVSNYEDGKFEVWSDSHNATYLAIDNGVFKFQCRFLHESYDLLVTPSSIFTAIKNKYRGVDHFISAVKMAKKSQE